MINLNHAIDLIQSFKQVAADRNVSDRRGFDLGQVTEQVVKGSAVRAAQKSCGQRRVRA